MRTFRRVALLVLAGQLAQPAAAQGLVKLRRAWLDPVDSVTVMPPYALDQDLTGLLIYSQYPRNGNVAPRGYWFSWPFTSIDGQLGLYITRRQIYLQSGHNNPNPNHLYWVQNITPVQFQAINAVLGRLLVPLPFQTAAGTDCGYFRCLGFQPKESANVSLETEAQWEAFRSKEAADLAQRVRSLLQELNYHLPSNGQLSVPPAAGLFDHGTHVAWSVDELLSGGFFFMPKGRPDANLSRNFSLRDDAVFVLGKQQYRLGQDYAFVGYAEQRATRGLTLHWQRKSGVSSRLPATLTLQCRKVDKLVVKPADTGPPALDQQLWFAHLPHDVDAYELVLGLESGRTLHISCAEARLTAAP
ncbi:hypothetical protein [Hymenobacter edaphi]|uniref:Uncharacterized protein n=1 Tax=Hymenobacter edaphi TaxID=2211146 RepID=A0A328BLC3_9BACT|nr:hypothetical protein [Hymenobacter edaphi]RAK65738.1 hypothetical protein DLM85_13525 [Hymenobacter edaphi]